MKEEGGNMMADVATAIKAAIADVNSQALVLISAAVGLGVVFWGAKLLWTKFKGMAK